MRSPLLLAALAALACAPTHAGTAAPADAEGAKKLQSADPDDVSGPVVASSALPALNFEPLSGPEWPALTSLTLAKAEPPYRFVLVVLTPSREDSRFHRHQSMLSALFHPHDQPPNLLYVYASTKDRLERAESRLDYQVDLEGSTQLHDLYGEFAVLLLDGSGQVLLESDEPLDRYELHEAMNFVEGRPHPEDRPPGPPSP